MLDKGKLRTFVLGGIAGAAVGILLSPKSGRELRGSIANRAGEARERGRETYLDAQERARERLAEARDRPPPRVDAPESAPSPQPAQPPRETTLAASAEGPNAEPDAEEPVPETPLLRDVSAGAPPEEGGGGDPEELRRRIRETRSRLRERSDGPGSGGTGGRDG